MAAFPEYFPESDSLDLYIRYLADCMGLRDWKVTLEEGHPGEGNLGHCECVYGRKVANIRLAEHETIEQLRYTIVHELVHPHLDPARHPIENVRNTLGQPLYDATHDAFVDAIEYATDGIATAWADMLPLPAKADVDVEVPDAA